MTESLLQPAAADLLDGQRRLFLFDGMALLYRAHFALVRSPRYASTGLCTSGIFGMANTIIDLIQREKPSHMAVAFDTSEPTERHKRFAEYKAQRDEMPEDIAAQLPWVDRLFKAFNITTIRIPGFEADDIIGTLAGQASDQNVETWMVTPDKDYDQLVSDHVSIFKPGRKGSEFERIGVPEVLRKWDIERVDQVIDMLGLIGDSSDNVPGVPGIGPKTAQKLIAKYGTLEALLEQVDDLKGKQRERLIEYRDKAILSKWLVTIKRDVPHDIKMEDLRWQGPDEAALRQLFVELEFQTIGKRVFGDAFSIKAAQVAATQTVREQEIQASLFDEPVEVKTIDDVPHTYHVVRDAEARRRLLAQLQQQPAICFDTETTGLDPRTERPLGLAFALQPHEAYYVVCPENATETAEVLETFREVFEDPSIRKIGQNLKYDITLLRWHGIRVAGEVFDTMLAHSMKEPEMRHGLDYLAELYLGYKPISIEQLIGPKGKDQKTLADIDPDVVGQYACEDADITLQVARVLEAELEGSSVKQVCYDVECPLIEVLVDMEYEGIRFDVDAIHRYSDQLQQEIDALREDIFAMAGHEFNIDSPKQLGVVLYEELRVEENPKKTATGQYSTREAELERLSARHPIIRNVLEYRNAVKLKSVYVDQLPAHVHPDTGRIHTEYSQSWTATGRMQSKNPNLQTIPIRKTRGREIRAAFVARDEDHLLLSADYSQIELRVMAELSGDAAMCEAFQQEIDIHAATASKVYKVELDEVTREMRDKAKTVNFGIIYGISAFGLQQRLNIPRAEANALIENYFLKYPGVREYIDRTIAFAREHGYVETMTGRRRYLRDIGSRSRAVASTAERFAMNSPIQGTAADMLKLALINVHRGLIDGGFQTKMLLSVHDEIVFDMPREEQDRVVPVIEKAMKTALPMSIPIVVEMGVGESWLEAH